MNKTEKLIKNSGIYLIANFASKLLNVVLVPIYTVYIQSEDFGQVNLLLLFSSIIAIIFSMDVIDAAYRFLLDEKADRQKVITNAIFIYAAGAFLFSVIYFPIVIEVNLRYGILLGFHILITNFQSLIQQMARGMKYNKIYASSGVLMCLVQGISNIVMIVWFGIGGVSILIAPLIASFVTILYINIGAHVNRMFSIRMIEWKQMSVLIKYGAPVCVGILFNWMIANSGTYILTWVTGTAALSGIFALANKFPTFINAFTSIFNLAWQETAVEEYGSDKYIEYYNRVLNKFGEANLYAVAVLLPLIAGYFSVMNAGEYASAKAIVPFLLMSNIFGSMQSYLITGYYVVKRTKAIYVNALIAGVITVLLGVVLIPAYEMYGLVASVVLGQMTLFLVTYKNVQNYVAYEIDFKRLLIPLLIVVLAGVIFYSQALEVQVLGLAGICIIIALRERTLIKKLRDRVVRRLR